MKSITTTMMRVRERESAREREKIENQGKVAMRGKKIRSKTTISCGGLSGTQTRESAFASFCARDTSIFYFYLFYIYIYFFLFFFLKRVIFRDTYIFSDPFTYETVFFFSSLFSFRNVSGYADGFAAILYSLVSATPSFSSHLYYARGFIGKDNPR